MGSPRLRHQHGQVLVRTFSRFTASAFSLCPPRMEEVRDLCAISFTRTIVSFMRLPPSWPRHLPKAPPPNTIKLGIRISTYELAWGGYEHSDHSKNEYIHLQNSLLNLLSSQVAPISLPYLPFSLSPNFSSCLDGFYFRSSQEIAPSDVNSEYPNFKV